MINTELTPNAENGNSRVVSGQKINTAEIVNEAIASVNEKTLDLAAAEAALKAKGWVAPTQAMIDFGMASETGEETIRKFATQTAILSEIEVLSGASTSRQVGKWDFTSAQTICDSFDAYLWQRVHGHRQKFSSR